MIKNYFKIAWRNLLKNKVYSIINVIGLALGLGCFIVISLYVIDELSYDRFHEKLDRIYRVNSDLSFGGVYQAMAYSADPMEETLKNDYPQVEDYVRFYASTGARLIKKESEYIKEEQVVFTDSTLFDVFTLPMIKGDPKTALKAPNNVVLTESSASRYFGSVEQAYGKTLTVQGNPDKVYNITGIIEDLPQNSHFHYDFYFSIQDIDYQFGNFLSHNFYTYVVLKEGTDYNEFNKNFDEVMVTHILPQIKQFIQIESLDDFADTGNFLRYSLFPMTDIHLKSDQEGEIEPGGNMQYVYIFSAVAIFILLIACVNFMNLTTARSSGRAKEVGIRKALGTEKKNLMYQFLTESTLVAILAMAGALLFVWLSLDWFNGIAGKQMHMGLLVQPTYLIFLAFLPFVVGGLAGLYPAVYLSSFKPISVLKGKLSSGNKRDPIRSFLVIFQFSTSIALIVGTIIIYSQLNHIQNSELGFNRNQVLTVENMGIDQNSREVLKSEIEQFSEIQSASFGGYIPVAGSSRSDTTFSTDAVMTQDNGFSMQYWQVDHEYIPTMGMEVVQGRNFDKSMGTDSTAIIVNEMAAKASGFENPIGKKLYTLNDGEVPIGYTIIGIVKNFNFESLRSNVKPLAMRLGTNSWVSVFRFDTADVSSLVSKIESKYKAIGNDIPFEYRFMDESFDMMYRQERRVGKVALTFAILAIVIACLGLFGLATYVAEQRRKEIGIRKVLGASVANIVQMISRDFVKLVGIAFLIATPLAWFAMDKWLEDFAFRIDIEWWVFVLTGVIALLISILTLSFQAIKAAIVNPVKSLRTE